MALFSRLPPVKFNKRQRYNLNNCSWSFWTCLFSSRFTDEEGDHYSFDSANKQIESRSYSALIEIHTNWNSFWTRFFIRTIYFYDNSILFGIWKNERCAMFSPRDVLDKLLSFNYDFRCFVDARLMRVWQTLGLLSRFITFGVFWSILFVIALLEELPDLVSMMAMMHRLR